MKIPIIITMLFAAAVVTVPALAYNCDTPAEPIQKLELMKAVENTEKATVTNVEITAPGLALINYGEKNKKQVVVTFAFNCSDKDKALSIAKNPTGFHVLTYAPHRR